MRRIQEEEKREDADDEDTKDEGTEEEAKRRKTGGEEETQQAQENDGRPAGEEESEEEVKKRRLQALNTERPRWSDIADNSDVESLLRAPCMQSSERRERLRVCSLKSALLSVGEERGGEWAQAGRILGGNAVLSTSATWSDPQSGRTQGRTGEELDVAESADVTAAAEGEEKTPRSLRKLRGPGSRSAASCSGAGDVACHRSKALS